MVIDGLGIIETHPIQYHAPIYRCLQQQFDIPVTVIYGSDCSIRGYRDKEFGETFAWDTDLLSGYKSIFLSQTSNNNVSDVDNIRPLLLRKILKELGPKAVLINGYWPHFNRRAIYECWRLGLPIFFRGDTTDHAWSRPFLKRIVRDLLLRFFYRRCQKLLYVGKNSYRHYERLGVRKEKLISSPHCVDLFPFRADEAARAELRQNKRLQLGIPDEHIVLIYSGKLSPRKDPGLIIRAVRLLSPDLRNKITVIFLGNGELKEKLKRTAATEPRVNSVFTGFQNQSQLSEYYHSADLLILPSRHAETWGLVANDALHHGVPCLVSDAVGCAPDLIESGRTGEVFKSQSASDLSAAIQKAICLINRKDIRESCRKKMENYTVEKAAEGIAAAYFSIESHDDVD